MIVRELFISGVYDSLVSRGIELYAKSNSPRLPGIQIKNDFPYFRLPLPPLVFCHDQGCPLPSYGYDDQLNALKIPPCCRSVHNQGFFSSLFEILDPKNRPPPNCLKLHFCAFQNILILDFLKICQKTI